MRIKGSIHIIHKLDNLWCFKYEVNGIIHRVPFIIDTSQGYQDSQEIEVILIDNFGITIAKPI